MAEYRRAARFRCAREQRELTQRQERAWEMARAAAQLRNRFVIERYLVAAGRIRQELIELERVVARLVQI